MATVTNQVELKNAIANRDPDIIVAQNISMTTPTNIGYAVSMKGEAGVSLFWTGRTAANPNMFVVTAAGDLTIESLILDTEGRDGTLVKVSGGKFTMNGGTIIRNVYGRTSQNGVRVGDLVSPVGGTFIMNGGLITGIDSSDAVFCGGGTVVMDNDAAIRDNMSAGITMVDTLQGGVRSSLAMAGHSQISNNQSRQGASAGIFMGTDVVMGVREGDAPKVTGNQSPTYPIGGWLLSDSSTLVMRYGAEISDNYAVQYGGGLAVQLRSTVSMYDDAAIKKNKCSGFAAGMLLAANSTITMEGRAEISENECIGRGGGIHLQSGSTLNMKGDAAIGSNSAGSGAGIYLNAAAASINLNNSSRGICGNIATDQGGGIFISQRSALGLLGQTRVKDNVASEGKGIYKMGTLNLSQSPWIEDGLFFDDLPAFSARNQPDALLSDVKFHIPLDAPEHITIKTYFAQDSEHGNDNRRNGAEPVTAALLEAYTDNVPTIVDTLTDAALIKLEYSDYVSPLNVPLVIAEIGGGYSRLIETDRAAWQIPEEFGTGYAVILNPPLDQVWIDLETYKITYHDLYEAGNLNPDSYKLSDLPIVLLNPGRRTGYAFVGWVNAGGQRVTEISAGTTGDLSLTAVWERLALSFDGNARRVCNVPKKILIEQDTAVVIPRIVPTRPCYEFIGWNVPASGSGKVFYPGDTVLVYEESITLYAQWHKDKSCYDY